MFGPRSGDTVPGTVVSLGAADPWAACLFSRHDFVGKLPGTRPYIVDRVRTSLIRV